MLWHTFLQNQFKISIRQSKQLVRYLKESSIEIMENVVMQKNHQKKIHSVSKCIIVYL